MDSDMPDPLDIDLPIGKLTQSKSPAKLVSGVLFSIRFFSATKPPNVFSINLSTLNPQLSTSLPPKCPN